MLQATLDIKEMQLAVLNSHGAISLCLLSTEMHLIPLKLNNIFKILTLPIIYEKVNFYLPTAKLQKKTELVKILSYRRQTSRKKSKCYTIILMFGIDNIQIK